MRPALRLGLAGVLTIVTWGCEGPIPPARMSSSASSSEGFASCPKDTAVVGGGYEVEAKARTSGKPPTVVVNRPTENGWRVECVDADGKTVQGCRAFVQCATIGQ